MKQTAVEWLVDEMNSIKGSSTNMNGKIQFLEKELNKLYEQAKAMEKEQIEDAWYAGDEDGAIHEFEQYYNETYRQD